MPYRGRNLILRCAQQFLVDLSLKKSGISMKSLEEDFFFDESLILKFSLTKPMALYGGRVVFTYEYVYCC